MLAVWMSEMSPFLPSGVSSRPAMSLKLCTMPIFMLSQAILETLLMMAVGPLRSAPWEGLMPSESGMPL